MLEAIIIGSLAGIGAFYVARKQARNKKNTVELNSLKDTVEERVAEDFVDLKRDHLVNKLQEFSLDENFSTHLDNVHAYFANLDFKHPRAHTFYHLLLPRLLKVKQAKAELSDLGEDELDTAEMYVSLNEWMDEILENRVDAIESTAEINAKVITLLTK